MKTENFHLELITPCFCAGANQSAAEVRPPSIRGKLRWWFRVAGGTSIQEDEVFGAIRGDSGKSSSVIIRVCEHGLAQKWQPIQFPAVSNAGYVLYFAKASANGARWVSSGALPVGSSFNLQVVWRRNVSQSARTAFDLAFRCFLVLGSLGLRSTRGLGCFACPEVPFSEAAFNDLLKEIKSRSPRFLAGLGEFIGEEHQILDALGAQLRGLRQGFSAGRPGHSNPTPLGSSSRPRQTSAVYLRPVRESHSRYRLVVFEAPADRVLGRESRRGAPRLGDGIPASAQAPQGGFRRK